MKKTTSQKFSKRLAQYGALSVAIAGVTGANAQEQIGYTNIPDYSGTPDPFYIIDFDGDTTNDLLIYSNSNGLYGYVYGSNKLLGSANTFYAAPYGDIAFIYPFALDSGAVISVGQNTWFNQFDYDYAWNSLNYSSCSGGNWCDVTDKFIGVQFKIGSNTHYGWARLDVATNGNIWTLKDFAYNMTPDALILAGQTTSLSIDDNTFSNIKIVSLHKSIGVYNLKESTNYRLLNMTGQEVLKGQTSNRDYVIEASTLASGIYIIELGDTKTNAVYRKKVVLQ